MTRTNARFVAASVVALGLGAGCAQKAPEPAITAAPPAGPVAAASGEDAAAKATTEQAVARVVANLMRIHFEYDSDVLTEDARRALSDNAGILAAHPSIRVEVQGHCDARGTTEYNLALGQRRAESVVQYLERSAVSGAQVRAISFGKEKPRDARDSEEAWAQNRRVEFRVLVDAGLASVSGTVE